MEKSVQIEPAERGGGNAVDQVGEQRPATPKAAARLSEERNVAVKTRVSAIKPS